MELLNRFKTVSGTLYGTPKEIWGFRTKPHRGRPELIAHDFLKANKKILALEGIRLRRTRTIESLGAHHIIHQQRLKGIPIHRAYVTVHLGRDGHIYLVKNRAVPRDLLEPAANFKVKKASASKRQCAARPKASPGSHLRLRTNVVPAQVETASGFSRSYTKPKAARGLDHFCGRRDGADSA